MGLPFKSDSPRSMGVELEGNQNLLQGSLKHRVLGPTPSAWLAALDGAQMAAAAATALGSHLENWCHDCRHLRT